MKSVLHILFILLGMQVVVAQTSINNKVIYPGTQNQHSGIYTPLIVATKFNIEHLNINTLLHSDREGYSDEGRNQKSNSPKIITYNAYGNLAGTEAKIDKTIYLENIYEYYT